MRVPGGWPLIRPPRSWRRKCGNVCPATCMHRYLTKLCLLQPYLLVISHERPVTCVSHLHSPLSTAMQLPGRSLDHSPRPCQHRIKSTSDLSNSLCCLTLRWQAFIIWHCDMVRDLARACLLDRQFPEKLLFRQAMKDLTPKIS